MGDRIPAPAVPPVTMPSQWRATCTYMDVTGPEFALTVGHDLPLISAYDLMETLDRAPKWEPVTAPWKE